MKQHSQPRQFPSRHWCSLFCICVLQIASLVFGSAQQWREDFVPCGKQDKNCANGGVRTADWDFAIGDGQDHGGPQFAGWGNGELQCYQSGNDVAQVVPNPQNSSDGMLVITAYRARQPFPCRNKKGAVSQLLWSSARLHTRNKHSFIYSDKGGGVVEPVIVEARIKLPPPGMGLWAAFWMLPQPAEVCEFSCDGQYGGWPNSGEIDIMEAVNDMKKASSTLHFRGISKQPEYRTGELTVPNTTDGFHTYGLEWSTSGMIFTLDGVVIKQLAAWEWNGWYKGKGAPNAPFDKPFYIELNLAVGGLLPGEPNRATPDMAEMVVDWVKVTGGEKVKVKPAGTKPSAEGLPAGAIAGIAVGGAIILIGIIFCIRCHLGQRKQRRELYTKPPSGGLDATLPTPKMGGQTPKSPGVYRY